MNKFFLVLCGPTGSGKTDLSYALAQRFAIEVINGDVGQLYAPLSIGTAKPAWQESSIPHHLFDYVTQPRDCTVVEYRALVQKTLAEIWQRNALPVVVGGSFFYLRALFFPPEETTVVHGRDAEPSSATTQELWQQLFSIDPDRAQSIHANDRYRIQRALALWQATGNLPSQRKPQYHPVADFHVTCVVRDRDDLYHRIDERVLTMLQQGWIEEVAGLDTAWRSFLMRKKILGYPEIITCLDHNDANSCRTDKDLVEILQQKTRNYAKRQMTFWRGFKKDLMKEAGADVVAEVDLTLSSVDLYLNHTQQVIEGRLKGVT